MQLKRKLGNKTYEFTSLKEVFSKGNEEKSGDYLAGIGAGTVQERIGAKMVLCDVLLRDIRNEPLIDPSKDEVSRVIEEGVDEDVYRRIQNWSLAELRSFILKEDTTQDLLAQLSRGLTSDMIAGVTKLMSNLDLIHAANKIQVITKNQTSIGHKGTLSSRLQPNHPTDCPNGILASLKEGLSYGIGDAVIGINPVLDTAENISTLLLLICNVIDQYEIPTQSCVLGHITTQMEAAEKGAPFHLLFQSLAGTEAGNRSFGIDVKLLDEAYQLGKMLTRGTGDNVMYFETGQGSELSSESHFGVDQVTLESRCYGLAKRYQPFLVNTVVGFIGPEYLYNGKQVIRAGLEDHFMGKMHGLPMGVDVCYTNHMVADQEDIENLGVLLTSAGVNFLISTPMGDDCMLNYQSLSFHDIVTLQQLFNKTPNQEFANWLEKMNIYENGKLSSFAGRFDLFS